MSLDGKKLDLAVEIGLQAANYWANYNARVKSGELSDEELRVAADKAGVQLDADLAEARAARADQKRREGASG